MLQRLIERDDVDREWIAAHTEGWDELAAHVTGLDRAELLAQAGVDEETFERFVDLYAGARGAVLVWSMGITQHTHGVDGVRAIVNVGLARGNVGRDGAGLMPIRGHSGVQGGAEMGAYATAFPGGEPVDAAPRRRVVAALGLRRAGGARPDGAGDGRGRRARRARRALCRRVEPARGAARSRHGSRRRSAACRCACTRTSS